MLNQTRLNTDFKPENGFYLQHTNAQLLTPSTTVNCRLSYQHKNNLKINKEINNGNVGFYEAFNANEIYQTN